MPRASTQFSVGQPAEQTPFDLVQHGDDNDDQRAAIYKHDLVSGPYGDPGRHSQARELSTYGYATLRLYCPLASSPEVIALDLLSENEPDDGSWSIGFDIYSAYPSGYAGQQVVSLGRRVSTEQESLTWSGQREARLRYWHDDPTIIVLYQSDFVDVDGNPANPPVYRGQGRYVADSPVFGSMVVSYGAGYSSWRVFYDVPGVAYIWDVADNSLSRTFVAPKEPPLLNVYARNGQQVSFLSARREVAAATFPPGNQAQEETDFEGAEDPSLSDVCSTLINEVTVSRFRKVVFTDDKGRKLILKLAVGSGCS